MSSAALFLRLTDDGDVATLTDGINYSLSDQGFAPAIDRDGVVIQQLMVNCLGGASNLGSVALENQSKLRRLLENAFRWTQSDPQISPVRLEFTPVNSSPAKVLSQLVYIRTKDDLQASLILPPGYNDAENLTTNTIENVILNIPCRAPWILGRYTYENLATAAANISDPSSTTGWTATADTTLSWAAIAGFYGGTGRIRGTSTLGNSVYLRTPVLPFTLQSGTTYTVTFTYGESVLDMNMAGIRFTNVGGTIGYSNTVNPTTDVPGTLVTAGLTVTAQLTATVTTAAALLEVRGATFTVGQTLDIAEILIVAEADNTDTWRRPSSEQAVSTTSAAADNPSVHVVTFIAASETYAPTKVEMAGFTQVNDPSVNKGFLLVSDQPGSTYMNVVDWTPAGADAQFANFNDTANKPLGGTNVRRFTPTAVNVKTTGGTQAVTISAGAVALFASVRNNSLTTTFYASIKGTAAGNNQETMPIIIAPYVGAAACGWVSLGTLFFEDAIDTLTLYASASAAAGTLDIDALAWVRVFDGGSVLAYDQIDVAAAGVYSMIVDPLYLTRPVPAVRAWQGGVGVFRPGYRGDAIIRTKTTQVSLLWLACRATYWRHTTTGGTTNQPTFVLTRPHAYTVPK